MRQLLVLLGILFIFQTPLYSQEYESIQGFKLGVTPSALLNRWIGVQGKASYTFKNFELEANVGYLAGKDDGEPYTGIRIKPVLKYYFAKTDNEFYYFGFGGLHRKIDIDADGTFGRFDNSYFQTLDFKITQKMNGLFFMFGVLMPLRNDHFFVDLGLGMGKSKLTIEHFGIPEDAVHYHTKSLFAYDERSAGSINYFIFFGHVAFMYKF